MYNIIETPFLMIKGKQIKFPRSKKKRILKKWSKKDINFHKIADPNVYKSGDVYICHPQTARHYRNEINKNRN